MKRTASRQLIAGCTDQANFGCNFGRSVVALFLVAVLVVAAFFSSGPATAFAQGAEKPKITQEEKASREAGQTEASQSDAERRAAVSAAALVTEFDVNG